MSQHVLSEISAREIFSAFYEPEERAGSVAMLYRVFFDDSADGTRDKYVIAAGLLGRERDWREFDKKWKAARNEEPSIQWFHSKEWMALTGEFFQFCNADRWPKPKGREAANAKREKLIKVIEDSRLVALAVAVLVPDFNKIRAADERAADYFRPDPYEGAIQSFVFECAKVVKGIGQDHCVGYVSDDSSRAPIYSSVYVGFKEKNPIIAETMRGLTHLDDKKVSGLQAADLVAHLANQEFKKVWDKPENERKTESLPHLKGTFYKIAHWDLRYMCHILNDCIGLDLFDHFGIDRRQHPSDEQLDREQRQKRRLQ